MTTSNTETGIAVAYQDGDGTIDFTIDETASFAWTGAHTFDDTIKVDSKLVNGMRVACTTILQPEAVQAVTDFVPMFAVEATAFPDGIKITNVYLKASAFGTPAYSANFEIWDDPADATPTTITTITMANTTSAVEVSEAPDTTSDVGVGSIVSWDLTDKSMDWVQGCIEFYGK
jgi:hypothetical protein